jgi:hypothetical protein
MAQKTEPAGSVILLRHINKIILNRMRHMHHDDDDDDDDDDDKR